MSLAVQSAIDAAKPLHNALPAIDTEALGTPWRGRCPLRSPHTWSGWTS
jgi:hypothetical protein